MNRLSRPSKKSRPFEAVPKKSSERLGRLLVKLKNPESTQRRSKSAARKIKLPEKARQFMIKLPKR